MLVNLIQFLRYFTAMKAEVDKLDISELVNVPTSQNNLKNKVDDLDVGKLKTATVDLKKDAASKEVIKKTRVKQFKQVDNFENKIPDVSTFLN